MMLRPPALRGRHSVCHTTRAREGEGEPVQKKFRIFPLIRLMPPADPPPDAQEVQHRGDEDAVRDYNSTC
jgi:hypothetical protein